MTTLDVQLLAAHEAGDSVALIRLYEQAANEAGAVDAACFYLTHAYVFALEIGHPDAEKLRDRLVSHGREAAN